MRTSISRVRRSFLLVVVSLLSETLLVARQAPILDTRRPSTHRALVTPLKTLPDPTLRWGEIREAHLINSFTGWVLLGNKLLWTDTDGVNFSDITPPVGKKDRIVAAEFFDGMNGWAVINGPQDDEHAITNTVASTTDGGKSWILAPVGADNESFMTNYVGNADLSFVSPEVGFGIFQTVSSSAWSAAALFGTSDGGRTWDFITHHIGYGQIRFITPNIGWALGGMRGGDRSSLHRTIDGGVNWIEREYPFPPGVKDKWDMEMTLPSFSNLRDGVLEGTYFSGTSKKQMIAHYATSDEGNTWELEGSKTIQGGKIPWIGSKTPDPSRSPEISVFGADVVIQSSTSKHQTSFPFPVSKPDRLTIKSADFSDLSHGWIVVNAFYYRSSGRLSYSALISTSDGGAHLKTLLTDVDPTILSSENGPKSK